MNWPGAEPAANHNVLTNNFEIGNAFFTPQFMYHIWTMWCSAGVDPGFPLGGGADPPGGGGVAPT